MFWFKYSKLVNLLNQQVGLDGSIDFKGKIFLLLHQKDKKGTEIFAQTLWNKNPICMNHYYQYSNCTNLLLCVDLWDYKMLWMYYDPKLSQCSESNSLSSICICLLVFHNCSKHVLILRVSPFHKVYKGILSNFNWVVEF